MKYLITALIIVGMASAIYLQPNDQEIIADENNTAVIAAPLSGTLIGRTSPTASATVSTSWNSWTQYSQCNSNHKAVFIHKLSEGYEYQNRDC